MYVKHKRITPKADSLHNIAADVFLPDPCDCKTIRFLDGNHYGCNEGNLYYYTGRQKEASQGRYF